MEKSTAFYEKIMGPIINPASRPRRTWFSGGSGNRVGLALIGPGQKPGIDHYCLTAPFERAPLTKALDGTGAIMTKGDVEAGIDFLDVNGIHVQILPPRALNRNACHNHGPMDITWLGHGTFQFVLPGGETLVLDPWTDGNPAYPKGFEIQRCDTILVSHGHFDHIHDAVPLAKKFSSAVVAIFRGYLCVAGQERCGNHAPDEQGRLTAGGRGENHNDPRRPQLRYSG